MAVKKTDKSTLALLAEIKRQKAEIANAERPNWKTNCSFSYTGSQSNAINLHVATDLMELARIVAFLRRTEKDMVEACNELGIAPDGASVLKWNGYIVQDWVDDIKARIDKIQIASKKAKLAKLESRLNAIISPELRAQMELEAIAEELK